MKRILLISGMHGDEPSGPHIALDLLRKIDQYPSLTFDVYPFINPVGFARGTREGADGDDLNRWFFDDPHEDEPFECSLVREYLSRELKAYELVVSLHEDYRTDEFYVYDTANGKDSPVIQAILDAARSCNVKLWNGIDDPEVPEYNNVVENGYCKIQPDDPLPTLEEYLTRNGKAKRAITTEIPGKLPLETKIHLGITVLNAILEQEK